MQNIEEIVNSLETFGWKRSSNDLNDSEFYLSYETNLSASTSSGDYSKFDDGTIISDLNCHYNIYPNKEYAEYLIWEEGSNPGNGVFEEDDYEEVLKAALENDFFKSIEFPEFEMIIDSDDVMRNAWYDLVQLKEDYCNSLDQDFKKGDYFINWCNNTSNSGETEIYYPLTKEQAEKLIKMESVEDAVCEMIDIIVHRKYMN